MAKKEGNKRRSLLLLLLDLRRCGKQEMKLAFVVIRVVMAKMAKMERRSLLLLSSD